MVKWKSEIFVLVAVLLSAIAAVPYIGSGEEDEIVPAADDDSIRLPTDVIPVHYDLDLVTNVHTGARAFSGNVRIRVQVMQATNSITLHNRGLTIESVILTNAETGASVAVTHAADTSRDFLIITADTATLSQGLEYLLTIQFRGNLRTDMGGFYRSQYQVSGETVPRYLAATQFQSTSARSAFPNFDEPAMKATFKVSITHATAYEAISNTEGHTVDNADGTSTTSFETTPKMSSYLNAFVVSDFAYRSLYNGPSTTEHRIYARTKDVENVQASLENSYLFLKQLEDYCDYKYELNKMYSAAIPDFAAGAMENWGLILYKEQYLINNEHSHPRETLDMLRVTAHELAHQFFGNLVTYDWWDKIWLNEGFAAFFEYRLVELTYPEWGIPGYMNVRALQGAFRRDSLQSTTPMTFDGSIPTDISYSKGSSVIRMFQHSIGDELFRAALHKYLTDKNHQPVATEDLLAAFESTLSDVGGIAGLNFSRAFRTWELQKGYPLVTVTFDEETSQFRITQKKYLSIYETEDEAGSETSWYIPLSFTTGASPDFENGIFTEFFPDGQAEKMISTSAIAGFDASQWYLFNIQQLGYYRVNYDENNWLRIIEILNSDDYEKIHVLNRAQLVDDALTLAYDNVISYEIAFGVVSYLSRETSYIPWYPAVLAFDKINFILKGRPLHASFQRFVRKLLRKTYVVHGLENRGGMMEQFGRELAIDWTCRMGDEGCLTYAHSQLTEEIPKPLDIALVCNGLKGLSRQTEFVAWYEKFRTASDQADRLRYLDGLLCSSDPKTIRDLLETTLGSASESFYRSHERSRIYSNVMTRSSAGLRAMLDFIVSLYDEIVSANGNVISSWLVTASTRISDFDDEVMLYDTIDKIIAMGKTVSEATRQQIATNIDRNKQWVADRRYQDSLMFITNYLKRIDDEESSLRLLPTSAPLFYKIHLNVPQVQIGALPYTGEVTIDIQIKLTTDHIMFHSKRQTIDWLKVHDRFGNELQVLDHSLQTSADTLTIYFLEHLPANSQISVHIKYSTSLLTSSTGFYRTTYTQAGVTKYLAATQFQPSSARYSFPCYDEPGFKTPFELTITHDKSFTAIANTMGVSIDNGDGTVTTRFEQTPMMSSYLLAYVVSEFASITNEATRQPREVLHRVWTKPDSISRAPYALENSVKALKALESYCNFDYVMAKVDSAAIPNKNSAMENWGMVTYWETAMIYQENYNNISHTLKFSGVRVIAHELAHQFFGDAVTCEWWDQIWLNEGFATIMQYTVVDQFEPSWRMHDFMTTFTMHNTAFISDSRATTRPMTNYVETLSEIDNAFDRVAYEKSGCVIRMFQHAVGENIFRRSLQLYLSRNNLKPVTSQDLMGAFVDTMEANNLRTFDFDHAFRTWEHQKGYPVIHVRFDSSLSAFRITQQRFFEFKDASVGDESSWFIPLNFATQSSPSFTNTAPTHFFADGEEELQIPISAYSVGQWVVFNKQQYGYYRVNYEEDIWIALINVLNSDSYTSIHVMNRAQLIDDAFALARGGYIDYSIAFDILKYLVRENDFFPWYTGYRHVNALITAFGGKNADINKFFRMLSAKFYDKFDLNGINWMPIDSLPERYGRDYATFFACNNGNEKCLTDTYKFVHLAAHHDRDIPNGLERMYCSGLRGTGKEEEFVSLWQMMSQTADATFKSTLISALGCTDDTELLKDYLYSSLGSGNSVNYTTAQRQAVFSAALQSYSGLPVVLDFLDKAQSEITSYYGRSLVQLLTTIAATIRTPEDQQRFTQFMLTREGISGDQFLTLSRTVSNNLVAQENFAYQVSQIHRILDEWENGASFEGNVWLLPHTSRPEHYRVHFDVRNIHTGALGYSGDVTIDIEILEKTNHVVFHSKTQVIREVTARNLASGAAVPVAKYRLTPSYDTIIVYFTSELAAGTKVAINIKYSTNLLTSGTGFYRTSYTMDGVLRYVGATQFESTGARYAFPCYDEPDFKAVFEVSFTHDSSVNVLANTMETILDNGDGTTTTSFEPSPIMSSYLNAFLVSDFEYIDNSQGLQAGQTLQRVVVQSDALNKAPLALIASISALTTLEEFVGFKYEISKLDSVQVPGKSGAMENWGLITYRPNALIYEENIDETSHTQLLSGIRVISHEVAHQFFGNAVTCKWWSYIWLNEGFAQFMQYKLTDAFYPEWRMNDLMNILMMQGTAFISDARASTRAMTSDATTPAQISALFDNVAYDKSGSVLRMFMYAVTEPLFRQSLNLYVNTNNHKGAVSQDLIDAFKTTLQRNNFNELDFERAFRTWETQKGYPVIRVSYQATSPAFHITQQRFFSSPSDRVDDGSSWYIPLNFATSNNPDFADTKITNYFLNGEPFAHIETETPIADTSFWYVFNKQQRSYYRVNYDASNWAALSDVLNSDEYTKIHVMNRAQLIDDSYALVNAGYLNDYQTALDILKYLHNEDDYFPWYVANRYLSPLFTAFGNKNEILNAFVKRLSAKFYAKYKLASNTVPQDVLPERYGRALAFNLACNAGNEDCLADAFALVHNYAHNDVRIPLGLESILCHGFRGLGKQVEFVEVWGKMQLEEDATYKSTLLSALGCTDDPVLLKDYLESSLGSGANSVNYTAAQRRSVLSAVLQSRSAMPIVITFLNKFPTEIVSRYGQTFVTTLTTIANSIRSKEDQALFSEYLLGLSTLTNDQLASLLRATGNNMNQQTSFANARQLEVIKGIVGEWEFGIIDGHQLRLPESSKPEHYKIHLDVRNIHTGVRDYTGEVTIDITMLETTNRILFHSANQVINEVKVHERATSREVSVSGYRLFPSASTIMILFSDAQTAGSKLSVHIKFSTSLLNGGDGFYQTSYTMDGRLRYVGATQFESTGARYAFPCYDEPDLKAVFELTFTHDSSVNVFANTMERIVPNGDGTTTTYFGPSPIMSSYLNAFVVSDFEYIDNSEFLQPGQTLQRVIVQSDSLSKAPLALVASVAALNALEEFAGFKYEPEKLDSIQVPGKGGAMENWGLITYAPSALIYTDNIDDSPHTRILSGVRVISHEVAHQFFGNAVTCKWWSYIWLNEGFAQFLQYRLTDMFYPEWRMNDFMNILSTQGAFVNDGRNTTRAMTTDALTPTEIDNLFDTIAYDKSGNVLRTFMYAIGEDVFRQSLSLYLSTNNHKGAVSQDLMDAIVSTMQRLGSYTFDFDRAFRTWENQKGYPVIHAAFNASSESFQIRQQRFFAIREQRASDSNSWFIPLNYATQESPNFADTRITDFFQNGVDTWHIHAPTHSPNNWFVFNKQQRSYYRVNYNAANWAAVSEVLSGENYNVIHVMNRAQLIDDSFALTNAGYLDGFDTAFGIMKYLVNENDFFPWYSANRYLSTLYTVFGNKNDHLNSFVKILSEKFYAKYKLPTNSVIPSDILPERYGRALAINLACVAGNQQCLDDAHTLVRRYIENDQKIPAGLESILCHGLRGTGKTDTFVQFWQLSQVTADATWKTTLLNALGCTDDETLLFDYLESSLGSGSGSVNYTAANRQTVFQGSLQSKVIVPVFVQFMKKNNASALSNYRYTWPQILTSVAQTIKTREDQYIFNDYIATVTQLSPEEYRLISLITSNAMIRQNQPEYAAQIEVITEIFSTVPRFNETTTQSMTAPTTTSTPSTTLPSTPTTSSSSSSSSSPTTTEPGTTPTPTTTTPITTPSTTPSTTTTQGPDDITPTTASTTTTTTGASSAIGVKFATVAFCLALALFNKIQ